MWWSWNVNACVFYLCSSIINGQLRWKAPGQSCGSSQECIGENYLCESRTCTCPSNFVEVGRNCLPKIKPGHSPCYKDEQCQAVWPETHCVNTICQCLRGTHLLTRDGIVCIEDESCPLGGKETVLKNLNGTAVECFESRNSLMTGCSNQLSTYDCLKDRADGGKHYCCPNRANACSQPMDPGRTASIEENEISKVIPWYFHHAQNARSPSTRWYMNKSTGECTQFSYIGTGGNANNFLTKEHCENYCKGSCPRGNPKFRNGPAGEITQFSQRQQICDPSVGCGDPSYKCTIIQPGKAFCCPTKEFICSELGGVESKFDQTKIDSPYTHGVFCGPTKITSQRFYFDVKSKSCLSFEYYGCGGNFNNFETKEQCENYCTSSERNGLEQNPILSRN